MTTSSDEEMRRQLQLWQLVVRSSFAAWFPSNAELTVMAFEQFVRWWKRLWR